MVAMNSVLSASGRRRGRGRPFVKGMSGNPNGRPKIVFEIRDLAQQYGPAAITRLAELSGLAPGTPAQAEATQVAALKELLIEATAEPRSRLPATTTHHRWPSTSAGPMHHRAIGARARVSHRRRRHGCGVRH